MDGTTHNSLTFPKNEAERLAHLQLLEVLDSGPEPIFDALARTASLLCETPIALLSLVDADRQWFKSNLGLEGTTETPREYAFCAHTILQSEVMEVHDAWSDSRFKDNPLVIGKPDIRFYAGAPVTMPNGENIGTLCVIDRSPKSLTAAQRSALANLADAAANALVMRKKALELDRVNAAMLKKADEAAAKEALYHSIVEEQSDLISLALPTGELTFVNEAYAAHFGLTPETMIGHNLLEYVSYKDRAEVKTHLDALCQKPSTANGENQMRSSNGDERWVAWSNRSIGDPQGNVIALHSVGRDITDRKRFELALASSQERFRALYESTPAMLDSIDPSGRILHVSDTWLAKLGYNREEVIGRHSTDFLTPASQEYARNETLPAFFASGRCEDIAYQMVRKDGQILDVRLSAVLERDFDGRPVQSLAVIQDVTESNAIEKAFRVNEERLALATTVNQIGIWEVDLQSGRLDWSDTMFTIFGGSRETFQGQLDDWSSKVYPEDLAMSQAEFKRAIETNEPMDFDFRVQRENGDLRVVNARAVVIKDPEGKATRVLGTNYDVTERKAVERALEYSEKRMRTIANNLPILISHIDIDYRYTFANNNYQSWFKLDQSVEGRTVPEVFGNDVFECVRPKLDEALCGKEVTFEHLNPIPDAPINLLVHYVPDRDSNGRVQGIFGMVLDRTEQRGAQARLEASERQLRAVTDNLPVLISYVDSQERLRFMNATFGEWMGVEPEWASGRDLQEVIGAKLYEQRREFLHRALAGERVEFEVMSEINGRKRHLQTTYVPEVLDDGSIRGLYALSTDVTELKRVELELRKLVRIDSLTGLPNRRDFEEKLDLALLRSRRTGRALALMFLDVDHFKSINDTLGHGVGDQVLCQFAKRIRSVIRVSDTAARLAGDEFVIILEDLTDTGEVEAVARKLVETVRRPMQVVGTEVFVTTSVGVAFDDAIGISASQLVERADKALYKAKAASRDTFVIETGFGNTFL